MDPFDELVVTQHGMVARRQLTALGIDADRVRIQVAARRWLERTPRVISTTTGPLSRRQLLWLAGLHAGPRSMIGSLTAAGEHGLTGWTRPDITVLVDDELSFEPIESIDFFRSRRCFEQMQHPREGLPLCRLEPALLLYAGYEARSERHTESSQPPCSNG